MFKLEHCKSIFFLLQYLLGLTGALSYFYYGNSFDLILTGYFVILNIYFFICLATQLFYGNPKKHFISGE